MMNDQNLKPNTERTPSERTELARKAGKASGKARRERKTLADTLRKVLDEKTPDKKMTKQEAIVAKVITRMFNDPKVKDLKTLAEILGEYKQVVEAQGDGVTIIVKSEDEKDKIKRIGELGI